MTPSKTEEPSRSRSSADMGTAEFERKLYRKILFGLFLAFAYVAVMAAVDRFVSPGAGNVLLVLPLALFMLYAVWKAWIQKLP